MSKKKIKGQKKAERASEMKAEQKVVLSGEQTEAILQEMFNSQKPTSGVGFNVSLTEMEYIRASDRENRRLYLYGEIIPPDNCQESFYGCSTAHIIETIIAINYEDQDKPFKERQPIWLLINSPGGSTIDGYALASTILASKTPVHTVNVGKWYSMAFLIGIVGHMRYSLKSSSFLMHDGSVFSYDSSNKVYDQTKFLRHYDKKITREFILGYTKINKELYKKYKRRELYMLPEDVLRYGVIDRIIESLDEIF